MKRKPFLSEFKNALYTEKQRVDKSFYGVVQDVVADEDGKVKAYKVNLGGDESTVEARKFAGANIGDTVMCMLMANGQVVVTGRRDGDQDAKEAREVATRFIRETSDGIVISKNSADPDSPAVIINNEKVELKPSGEESDPITVNDAKITINQGGAKKGEFTVNQSSDLEIDLDGGGGGGGITLQDVYPVGSIYMTVNNVNPSTWISGTTWVAWGAGRVPVGVGTSTPDSKGNSFSFENSNQEGGRFDTTLKKHNHKSYTDDSPNRAFIEYNYGKIGVGVQERSVASGASGNYKAPVVNSSSVDFIWAQTTGSSGYDDVEKTNMQPYITCYMWRRTD